MLKNSSPTYHVSQLFVTMRTATLASGTIMLVVTWYILSNSNTFVPKFLLTDFQTRTPKIFPLVKHKNNNFDRDVKLKFLPFLKNPCWFQKKTGLPPNARGQGLKSRILRCLPYFFILGQPKCGTTDLLRRISVHPDLIPATQKGPNWWTRKIFDAANTSTFDSYLEEFSTLASRLQTTCNLTPKSRNLPPSCSRLVTVDGSTSTLWDSKQIMEVFGQKWLIEDGFEDVLIKHMEMRNVNEGVKGSVSRYPKNSTSGFPLTVADLIRSVLPKAKFIVVLRNPVDRLFSGYKFFRKKLSHPSPLEFDNLVKEALRLWRKCCKRFSERYCAYDRTVQSSMKVRLYIGMYNIYLRDWFTVFPREQFLILRTEDYSSDMRTTIKRIFDHLQMRPLNSTDLDAIEGLAVANENRRVSIPEMLPRTREKLAKFYQKFNTDLAQILNEEKFLWKDS